MQLREIGRVACRAVRLQCPRCGHTPLFDGWFSMYPRCTQCAFVFEPEQGYFVGAIYLNYAATVLIAIPGFLLLDYATSLSLTRQLLLWGIFAVLFPLFFFRYSRSLWLGIDYVVSSLEKRP